MQGKDRRTKTKQEDKSLLNMAGEFAVAVQLPTPPNAERPQLSPRPFFSTLLVAADLRARQALGGAKGPQGR